jgi:hypothetical protein
LLYGIFYREHVFELDPAAPHVEVKYVVYCLLRVTMAWCAILACLGYAARYLRFNNPLLGYLNEAVYPLFILHLTATVVLSYWVVPLDMGLWPKYLLITSSTLIGIFAIYHFCIRPFGPARLLFGLKPRDDEKARALPGDSAPQSS